MRIAQRFSTTIVILIALASTARAAEICGNGLDDDSDGLADEGCDSNSVMGVCPSPLSCELTGDVAPVSGAWVYALPPDFSPAVAYGPKLQFQRMYMSMSTPSATNYRTAMGPRWGHNFQSWLDKSGSTVIVHLTNGQEVKFTFSNTSGGFDYYTPQVGAHFKHLRQATTSPNNWELKTLTGETYKYNWTSPTGKLIEIWDTLPTPNKIVIAYLANGSNKGQIDTVTDATGKKRFKFSYSSGRVSSVAYQTVNGGTGTTRATLSISYTSTNPTTVQLGGTTFQTLGYTSNYLTSIVDGAGKNLITTNYVSATPGKVANITVPTGAIGYDYASSNAQCTGNTALFFNLANTGSCNVDSDCGTGFRCGGKTGSGSTGKCYRAARCMTTSSPSEDLVTTITPFTPCTGACAPVAQYSWNTSTLDLKGVKLADNNWTSFQRNSDGLVTLMAEGDTDDDPTNAGSGAKTWFFYGSSNFPGRVTESRRRSDVQAELTCDGTPTGYDGCKRSQFGWSDTDGLLLSKTSNGWSYDASNTLQPFTSTTTYSYDNGRLSQIDGPLAGSNDVTQFTFWTSSDVLKDGYVNLIKRKKDSTSFLTTTLDDYDYFGNAKSTQDPDGTFTCRTWDPNRNYLSQVREAMATVQTSCATTDPGDLITSYTRDTALRLTQTTRPVGDCEIQEYDTTWGRLTNTKLRDDCNAASTGDTRTDYYDANGYNEKTEFLDSTSTVTRRMIRATLDGSQLGSMTNPVTPAYARTFSYFADAKLQTVSFENGLGRTDSIWDSQNRQTTNRRYTDATGSALDWVLQYPQSGATSSKQFSVVTDPASKATTTDYDDLGRKNRVISPDTGTTLFVYDAASRLVTEVIGYTSGAARTNTFTYDNLGRRLTEDYDDRLDNCTRTGSIAEVTYGYDSSPVTCPGPALCTRQTGRLAYVKSELLCDSTKADFTLDQETFMAYDEAGRLVQEYLKDDSGSRTADQRYAWDKNGNLKEVTAPSQAAMTYTLGGAGNSDANRIVTVARTVSGTPTNLLTGITWTPFGPVAQYDQANTISGNALRATFTWNLAYRAAQIKYAVHRSSEDDDRLHRG